MSSYLAGGKTVVGSMLGLHPEGLGLLGLKCLRIWACRTSGGEGSTVADGLCEWEWGTSSPF